MLSRKDVFSKCNGKCAFCGYDLTINKMQVTKIKKEIYPCCKICKEKKGVLSLEQFRAKVFNYSNELWHTDTRFRLLDYLGVISVNKKRIEFYFERKS